MLNLLISIHAPPRGATVVGRFRLMVTAFQFTPLREGRQRLCSALCTGVYFNSRPSARGDFHAQHCMEGIFYFNSRPSARGDMNRAERRKAARDIFQFTPLREGRHFCPTKKQQGGLFQFTPLREGRRKTQQSAIVNCDFNSRPSARGDGKTMRISARIA